MDLNKKKNKKKVHRKWKMMSSVRNTKRYDSTAKEEEEEQQQPLAKNTCLKCYCNESLFSSYHLIAKNDFLSNDFCF